MAWTAIAARILESSSGWERKRAVGAVLTREEVSRRMWVSHWRVTPQRMMWRVASGVLATEGAEGGIARAGGGGPSRVDQEDVSEGNARREVGGD